MSDTENPYQPGTTHIDTANALRGGSKSLRQAFLNASIFATIVYIPTMLLTLRYGLYANLFLFAVIYGTWIGSAILVTSLRRLLRK